MNQTLATAPSHLKHFFCIITLFLLCLTRNAHAQSGAIPFDPSLVFYASPTGTASGNGTLAAPWDLQTVFNRPPAVLPGSTIFLLAGTYTGNFISELTGTAAKPIILRPAPGARVIIDGSRAGQAVKNVPTLLINGPFTWFIGMEITNSDPERIIPNAGSNPPDRRGPGISIFAEGLKLINLIVHDNGEGIDAWTPGVNNEYYGNLIFNNGWYAPDREHGHGVYTQNNTGTKRFINNISLNNFSYGWQVFGSANASLKNYYLEGNLVFNNRWLIGGGAPLENIELNGNFTYKDTLQIGYASNVLNNNLILRNNYFANLVKIYYWNNVTVKSNTLFAGSTYNYPVLMDFEGTPNTTTFSFDSNTYHWSVPPPATQAEMGIGWENNTLPEDDPNQHGMYYLPAWRQMGQDVNATVQNFPQRDANHYELSGSKVFVRNNIYDPLRANIIVYNWDRTNNVTADVTGILAPGDRYELHSVLDYYGDVVSGIYNGGPLTIPMTGHTVAYPTGYPLLLGQSTFPEFGTFILLNTTSNIVLPVQFTGFTVSRLSDGAMLQWSTAQEQNVSHFVVERSGDGQHFDAIGTVAAINTPVAHQYGFKDPSPLPATNYYRIREVTVDHRSSFSSVQKLAFDRGASGYVILQNPASQVLKVQFHQEQASTAELEIRNAAGHLLNREQKTLGQGISRYQLPIASLPRGTYFLTVKTDQGSQTRAFVIQ